MLFRSIDRVTQVGELFNSPIRKIEAISFIQIEKVAERKARERNKEVISMIKNAIENKGAYYADHFSLTTNMKTLLKNIKEKRYHESEARFCLNDKHCKLLSEYKMDDLITPVILGFYTVNFQIT